MAIFRQVHISFWNDVKVIEEMTPEDKFFYLYLLTNPHTKQIGVYQLPKKVIGFEMGYSIETINSLMERFENHHKVIKYNKETREIAILNWGKYNLNNAGKPVQDLLVKEIEDIKDIELIREVIKKVQNQKLKDFLYNVLTNNKNKKNVKVDGASTLRITDSQQGVIEKEILEDKKEEVRKINTSNVACTQRDTLCRQEQQQQEKEQQKEQEQQQIEYLKSFLINFKESEIKLALKVAKNDAAVVREKYNLIKSNSNIKNVVGALVTAIKEDWEPHKSNSNFTNYEQRNYDFQNLEKKLLGWDQYE